MLKYFYGFFKYLFYKRISKFALIDFRSKIKSKVRINIFVKIYDSTINEYTYVGKKTEIINADIGKFCSIAKGCNIGLTQHSINCISTNPIFTENINGTGEKWIDSNVRNSLFRTPRVLIGNDVWIGTNVIIMSGVVIGDGAIVGAGSIVTKDIPPYAIVAGVPAKIIRYRFGIEIIEKLTDLKWWDSDPEILKRHIDKFQNEKFTIADLDKIQNDIT
jgi:acetyltransferase-like isoleucine patch superfamily enzyme